MSRSLHAAHRPFRPGLLPTFRQWLGNFFHDAGLTPTSARTHANQGQGMSATAHHPRNFLSLPRDFIRRRRISNAILIPLLSCVAAYFITRQTGGSGFSLPKSAQQASLSSSPNPVSLVRHNTSTSSDRLVVTAIASYVSSPMISGAYKLADGPHAVTEVPDS